MKFGKYLEARQLELPEYLGHFIDYKGLKKVIKRLTEANEPITVSRQAFFFKVERELEKVNLFYVTQQSALKVRLDILSERRRNLLNTHLDLITCRTLASRFKELRTAADALARFVALNETGFRKILKKWDKRTHSHMQDMYLLTAVHVQPVFDHDELAALSDAVAENLVLLEDSFSESLTQEEAPSVDALYLQLVNIACAQNNLSQLFEAWIDRHKSLQDSNRLTSIMFLTVSAPVGDFYLKGFFDAFKDQIDLNFIEEYSGRGFLHVISAVSLNAEFPVSNLTQPDNESRTRFFLAEYILSEIPENSYLYTKKDTLNFTPLHCAANSGRADLVALFLSASPNLIESLDKPSPLILAVKGRHKKCVELLLKAGGCDSQALAAACEAGDRDIVELLLHSKGDFSLSPEGLPPLHLASKYGHNSLILLLVENGANVNSLCLFRKWPPLFYAAYYGHSKSVEELLKYGANGLFVDSKNRRAVFYAGLRGHVGVVNVLGLNPASEFPIGGRFNNPIESNSGSTLDSDYHKDNDHGNENRSRGAFLALDDIPSLSLPPPIIPLRKYGHNFLQKQTALLLRFLPNNMSFSGEPPGRLTITAPDLIPRNLMLPLSEPTDVVFEMAGLDPLFVLEFELYPKYGTKLIAKSVSMAQDFKDLIGSLNLPLLDARLRVSGVLACDYELVHAYLGTPLEVAEYATYWRSLHEEKGVLISLGAALSLLGRYIKMGVCMLADGKPIACPTAYVEIGGIKIMVLEIDFDSFSKSKELNDSFLELEQALEAAPEVSINIDIYFPTKAEISIVGKSRTATPDRLDLFLDAVLLAVFRVVRRNKSKRQIVFLLASPAVCKMLNWKQPNFPVFFCMGGVSYNHKEKQFVLKSANGYDLGDHVLKEDECTRLVEQACKFAQENNLIGIIISAKLLHRVPELADTVKAKGLILVGSREGGGFIGEGSDIVEIGGVEIEGGCVGVDGVRGGRGLEFEGDIEV